MDNDIQSGKVLPDTYGITRRILGETGSLRGEPGAMERVLNKKITAHLDNVNLDDFILAIGASEDINIVADSLDTAKTMTVHAEDVPLKELLAYISRNLGVAFYVGENMIWATPGDSGESTTPMETRMYRLRKGMLTEEIAGDGEGRVNIVEAIERFVPALEGSDLLFDKKAHVLIVKNTRQNLVKVEDLIDALDVSPPQVLIEARFISTSVSDLRELGIDWILNSPVVVSEKAVLRNGVRTYAPHTQINEGATIGFTPFPNESTGLNMTYQGILTDPMFQAVLHALETSGQARTLSVPKVTTINNRQANIRIGEDFRYFDEYDVESTPSTTDDGETVYRTTLVPVGSPKLEELGIELEVTPSVGADRGDITLEIKPEISEFVRYEFYEVGSGTGQRNINDDIVSGNNGNNNDDPSAIDSVNQNSLVRLPIFRRSTIETELVVRSGETVVMGGLISSSESETDEKVPFLSNLPIIGRLFMRDGVEESKQNLLIFVTASLLSERGEYLVPVDESTSAE
jgi:type II secretory pathway component GspD/PulD (secretin)